MNNSSLQSTVALEAGAHNDHQTVRPFFVGIGSSAGGLEALTLLLPNLPAGLGLRYVVVQHMSPTHRSMMSQLLGRTTALKVLDVTDCCLPLPDTVYVTPPNSNVVLHEDGTLRLLEPPNETVPKPSVNLFFTSLAEVVGDRAIGMVLSGTGSDGAIGLHAIKAAGGFSFAQEPGSAKYDGMVRAAIEAGGVDWVLPAESMGGEIARIVARQHASDGHGTLLHDMPPATLQTLLHSLYAHTRIDFTGYKEATLLRRIERRMTSTGCLSLDQYVEHARMQPAELQLLSQDMLISVTSFFRDRMAFDRLREEILRMLEQKPAGEEVRVWVAGCASGEEAYSIAIILHDAVLAQKTGRRVQVFATDIDDAALTRARRGVYPASLLSELDPTTLERHFVRHADGYEVGKALRGLLMFARHNLVQDPPFVRLDLVTCRNVMIYLQAPLQERLLKTLHYALNAAGLLFLGRSEGIHGSETHFEPIDRAAHLYRRLSGVVRLPTTSTDREASPHHRLRPAAPSLDDLVVRATAQRFAPASVLVDEAGEVRHFKGDLSGLMSLPDGRPGYQLMALLRRELRPELARLIKGVREGATLTARQARVARGESAHQVEPSIGRWRSNRAISADVAVRLSVQWVAEMSDAPMLLVCFEKRPFAEVVNTNATDGDDVAGAGNTALEEELATTREHLYTVIEELETSNEEAQSLNEEIQTANEELQSTNEELEASNEELAASNEELTTVNEELQVKNLECQAVNTELEGIYATVDFPLLAFDNRSLLTRTNRAVQRQIGMDDSWIGKHAAMLPWPEGMPMLDNDIEQVQSSGRTYVRQLTGVGARDWVLRIMPRMAPDGGRGGVLIQMEDNTQLRSSQVAAMRSDAQLRQLVERSAQLVCICDPAGRLQMANPEFERCHQLLAGTAAGKLVLEVLPLQQAQAFRNAQLEAMRRLAPLEVEEALDMDGEQRHLLASYYPLLDDDGAVSGVCYQALDVTRRKQAEAALMAANSAQLAAEGMARTKSSFLANMSHEIRTPMNAVLGLSRMALEADLPPQARDHIAKVHEAAGALTRILDDVLDFSKIEAGGLRFESLPFALDKLLLGVKDLFAANAQQKGLSLLVDMPLGLPPYLVGDRYRLQQILNNLVGNAVKFTQAGEVRLSVAPVADAKAAADAKCTLRFAVRDTGIGIASDAKAKLFAAFTQGDASVTRRFGGTGLGLAICQRLVNMMHGQLGVNSEQGKGSEFWFTATLPIADPTVAPITAAMDTDSGEAELAVISPAENNASKQHMLLVEDNVLNQIVSCDVLENLGYDVVVANDGQEALQVLCAQPQGHFAAVLMDLHMPMMDGLEATRRMRATPQGLELPIIALTAAAMPEDREQCFAAGMSAHISKPLNPAQLRDVLSSVMGAGSALRAPLVSRQRGGQVLEQGSDLPDLPGFELQYMLGSLHHNQNMAWRLLEVFVDTESGTATELADLLAQHRFNEAMLCAHSLKGSALSVGAKLVAQASENLNASLRAGLYEPDLLQSLQQAMSASLAVVKTALAQRRH